MNRARTTIEIIRHTEQLAALEDEWNTLWTDAGGHHNQAFRFSLLSWIHVAQPAGRRLCCVIIRDHGKLVLTWPLVVYRRGVWNVLNVLTPGSVEQTSMLVREDADRSALVDMAWQAAMQRSGADVVFMPFVRAGTQLHALAANHKGMMHSEEVTTSAALLRGGPDWKTLCKSLNRKPGVRERRLGRQGVMKLGMMELPDAEYAQWVDWILETKRNWAERVDKRGPWLYAPEYREFLAGLFDSGKTAPLAKLFAVELDGKVIAAAILGVGSGCHYYMIGSFLSEFSQFSPGTILNEFVIQWCIEQDMDLDFGVGTEAFKLYWARGNVKMTPSFQIANSLSGRLYFASKNLARMLSEWRRGRGQPEQETSLPLGKPQALETAD
jgi:CelD/BcsL family acetyltransferase involved in cellulose biosynthesis